MPKDKPYAVSICYDCRRDFLSDFVSTRSKHYCPLCGDNINVRYMNRLRLNRVSKLKSRWTAEEDRLLLLYYNKNWDWEAIADKIKGRSENGVKNRFKRLKEIEENSEIKEEKGCTIKE